MGYLPFKKMGRKKFKPKKWGKKKNQCTRIGLVWPSTTLKWLSGFGVKKPYSLHIPSCSHTRPAVEMLGLLLLYQGDSKKSRLRKTGPQRMAIVRVHSEWGLVRKGLKRYGSGCPTKMCGRWLSG